MSKAPIERAWKSYLREVVPSDATPEQIWEYRMIFFAGAQSALHEAFPESGDPGEGAANCRAMMKELVEFNATLSHGNA